METTENSCFKIILFPWLAHGHIFPYLELAKRILKRKRFHIYFLTTAINFSSINNFIEKHSLQDSIELVQLHLQSSLHELPPHYHTTKNLPSDLGLTLFKAFQTSKSSFPDVINSLNPDLVIFDILQPWAARLASSQGIPAVLFSTLAAATESYVHHHYTCWKDINGEFLFPELCLSDYDKERLDSMVEFISDLIFDNDKEYKFLNYKLSSDFVLLKTNRGLEGKYIDYLSRVSKKDLVCVGPLVSDPISTNIDDEETMIIVKWLSKKDEHSTLYISFVSECFLSEQEIEEIAKGIELCNPRVNFVWVVRFPVGDKTIRSVKDGLLRDFIERVKDRGIIVEGWAPQAQILSQKNIGGFVSHCGWSSINESLCFGVPVIGMPIRYDMGINAKMLVDAGACVEVPRDEDNVFKGEEIAKAMDKVIVEESVGEELRTKARELAEKMKMEEEGGLDEAADKMWQLCSKKNIALGGSH